MAYPYMLTTLDNPYHPFHDFDSWNEFDISKGYHSCSLLARLAHVSSTLSDEINDKEYERAIEQIIRLNPFLWTKIKETDRVRPINLARLQENISEKQADEERKRKNDT